MEYSNYLSIRERGKGIPYGGRRANGDRNHGFTSLKGHPEAIALIPDADEDARLRALLLAVNERTTGVFTVGCISDPVADDRGFRRTGYVEFALNDREGVDAASYFPAFFHFDRLWKREGGGLQVLFDWELEPAHFLVCRVDGFTCAVTINTAFFASQAEADRCWGRALDLLSSLLGSIPQDPNVQTIY